MKIERIGDIGYPCSVERKDGSIFTVFYAHAKKEMPAEIFAVKWALKD